MIDVVHGLGKNWHTIQAVQTCKKLAAKFPCFFNFCKSTLPFLHDRNGESQSSSNISRKIGNNLEILVLVLNSPS